MAECPDKKVPPPSLRDLVSLRISDWHRVGEKLGFKELDLMVIQLAHSRGRDKQRVCQRSMFGKWLREHPSPHAHHVIHALRSAGETRAADELAHKYGEGLTTPVIMLEPKQKISNINMVISGPEKSGKRAIDEMIREIVLEDTTPEIELMRKNRSLLQQNRWTEYLAALNYQLPNLNTYPRVDLGELPEVINMAPILLRGPFFHLICFDLMEDMDTPVKAAVSNDQLESPLRYVSWKSVKQFMQQVVETVTTSWAHLTGQEPRNCQTTAIVGVHSEMSHQVMSELHEADAAVQQVVHTCGSSRSVRYCHYQQDRMIFDLNIHLQNTRVKEGLREVMNKPALKETLELDSSSYNLILMVFYRGGVLTLSDCKELGRLCGVRDEDLPALLKKVHDKLGLILFFPEVPKMKNLILSCSIELISPMEYFTAVALNGTPDYPRDPSVVRKTGEIPRSLIDVVISREGPGDRLTTSSLLQLLKHYKFLSDTESSDGTPAYFMPCLLQPHPSLSYQQNTYQHHSAAPLLFCFKHGRIPYGLFSALAAQLARVWRLDPSPRYKDHLTFIANKSSLTKVELTDHGDHIQLVVTDNSLPHEFYTRVRREVQRALHLVKVRYIHLSTEKCDIGFYCPRSQHNPHCAVVQMGHLKCTAQRCQRGRVPLEKRMKIWFTGEQALDDTIMQGFSNLLADTSISSDQDEEDIMQQVEDHIDEEGCLQLRVVRCALFGAPGVGKTSSMKRLTDQIENLEGMSPLPSTGIERPITVPLFSTTKHFPVLIAESEWNPQDLDSQLQMILQCIITTDDGTPLPGLVSPPSPATGQTNVLPVPTQPSGLSPSISSSKSPTTVAPNSQDPVSVTGPVAKTSSTPPQPAPFKPPDIHFVRDLLKKKSWKKIRNLLKEFDDVTLLNIVDTGGQPEYQDILPVLLGGSGLSLLFHNLSQDLEQPYPVDYRHEEGRRSIKYRSQLTTLQMLFQVLSTITITSSGEPPAAVLIGTHRDKVARSDLDSMEEKMHRAMEGTDFLESDMIQTFEVEGKKRIVYPLDNMTGTKAEIKRLQKIINNITKRFQRKPIPTSWLLFHLAMRYLYEDPGFCTMEQCVQLAARCGINEEEVPRILSYFHNHFGTILHFPDVPCLKDIVICNPSIIFKAINSLVAESFATNPDTPQMAQSIRETGEIPKSLLDRICSTQSTGILPALHIIELLKCHHLISEVYTSEAGQERRQTALFMPCLLQLCSEVETLKELHQQSIAPLFIHFSCGHIPMGLFTALIASLSECWILDRKQRYKNKVMFITDPSSLARCQLTMQLKYIQVQAQHRGGVEELNQVCITIRQTLLSTITAMRGKFTYLKGITPQLRLLCPVSTDSKEFATCLDIETPRKMLCSAACCSGDNYTHDLLPKHRIWFSSFEPDSSEFTDIGETSPGAATQVRKRKLTDEPPATGGESPEHVRTKRSSAQAEDVMEVTDSGGASTSGASVTTRTLSTDDLPVLVNELHEVFPKWFMLGLTLKVPIAQLKQFETTNNKDCPRCMIDVLEAWLKQGSNPSRSQLAAALRAPAVGHNDVAARIEQ